MANTRKKKTSRAPQKWHHKARKKVSLVSATIAAMSTPHAQRAHHWYQNRHIVNKLLVWASLVIIASVGASYGVAYWYQQKHAREPLQIGATFIPRYARYLGVDPQQTMDAMINDLGMRRFRLVSYWDDIEKSPGKYDFDELDWQFEKVKEAGGTVSLAIGLRQPRWPECHMPGWAAKKSKKAWSADLKVFMGKVIDRYKKHPSLETYQLENEYFMKVFGICPDHSRSRLVDEYNFVKQLDSKHPVIVSRSNNWGGVPVYKPRPDQFGVSIYKRVWDKALTKRYFEYPFPPWFYGMLAGAGEIVTGKDMIIHELQAEPWLPSGFDIRTASLIEQDKSLDAQRLTKRIDFAVETGLRTIDLWGVEWWYARKTIRGEDSVWEAGKAAIEKHTTCTKQSSSFYAEPINGRSRAPC